MTRTALRHVPPTLAATALLLTLLVPPAAGKTRSEISMSVVRNLRAVSVPEGLTTQRPPGQNGASGRTKTYFGITSPSAN